MNVSPTFGGDPDWAVPDAERVANAMLEIVTLRHLQRLLDPRIKRDDNCDSRMFVSKPRVSFLVKLVGVKG